MKTNNELLYLWVLIFFGIFGTMKAQTPGGTGLTVELWLQADKLQNTLPADQSDVNEWMDTSGKGINLGKHSSSLVPRMNYDGMNYNPSVEFYIEGEVVNDADRGRKLVSTTPFTTEAGKSYYTFYVSRLGEGLRVYANVLGFRIGGSDNTGWVSESGVPWMQNNTGGHLVSNSDLNKNYGVVAAIRPNINNSSYRGRIYHNGKLFPVGQGLLSNGSYTAVIGNSDTGSTAPFMGDIMEIIVLSGVAGGYISSSDLDKINSYLAIKYGLVMDGMTYFVNSDGDTVWSNDANPGYLHNIFGIGRDDASGLYEKQSNSYEGKTISIFVGDTLADLNVNNTTGFLEDKSFLVLGSNNSDDLIDYYYEAGQEFANEAIEERINIRQSLIYKAQKTGTIPSVNIACGGKYLLVSDDDSFVPADTRVYKVENGIAKDVVINDGDYICVASYEKAPGGVVQKMKVWLKGDDESSIVQNGELVLEWRDQTSYGNDYSLAAVSYPGKTAPKYAACDERMNFFPSVNFGQTDYLAVASGPMSTNAPEDFTSFVVYYNTGYESGVRLYTHGFGSTSPRSATTRYPAMGFAPRDSVGRIRNDGTGQTDVDGDFKGFIQRTAALQMINTHKAGNTSGSGYAIHDFGGWQEKVTASGSFGNGFRMASGGTLGGASITSGSFQGLISEVFFYERALSAEEQDKIRTYLGMKYAITLDADANNIEVNYDYILSDGSSVVWKGNSIPNNRYHRNVAGLVHDSNSDLFVNKSKSSAVGATVTMMVEGHEECGQGLTAGLQDLSAIYWGNNGKTTTTNFQNDPDICGMMEFKTSRIWLVQKTNVEKQAVIIRLGTSTSFPYNSPNYQVYLLVADSEEKLDLNEWDQAIPGIFIDGEQQINYTFTDEYTYFAIGVKQLPGTCEACDFTGLKKLDFSSWVRGATNQSFSLGDDFSANVTVKLDAPAQWVNRYPRASTQKSLREYRRRDATVVSTTSISFVQTSTGDSLAATASFDIFEVDYISGKYDNITVYGICGGAKVYPRLSYLVGERRSSYTIEGITARAKRRPTSSYTSTRGKLHVEFDYPVQTIFIEHYMIGTRTTGNKRIGIGSMELLCPQSLPPANEDGLIFTKQGPTEVMSCELVRYKFMIVNVNCAEKPVNFSDILEDGMVWVNGTLSLDDATANQAIINEYGAKDTLTIENLMVPGGSTLYFEATAMFKEDTTFPNSFENQAVIEYKRLVGGIEEDAPPLYSCDRLRPGCEKTKTDVKESDRPALATASITANGCYRENDEIDVTITVNNPNSFNIANTSLEISFNEEFQYINNSLFASYFGSVVPENADGFILVEGFNLPAGESTVTFKLKAPSEENLVPDMDITGNPILDENGQSVWMALGVDFEFANDSTDVCEEAILTNAGGYFESPYCSSSLKSCVITNRNVTIKLK